MYNYPTELEGGKLDHLARWIKLKTEQGAGDLQPVVDEIHRLIDSKIDAVQKLPDAPALASHEPNDLPTIRSLRPAGRRRIWAELPRDEYLRRLRGAMFSRFAGCTLGSPVELNSPESMEKWATYIGDEFPPVDFWSRVDGPNAVRYKVSLREDSERGNIRHVPSDDDIGYFVMEISMFIRQDLCPAIDRRHLFQET